MTTVDDVIRECGDTIDDVAHEVIRLRAQLTTAERERDEARRERDALKALAGVAEAGDGLLAVATEMRRLHERALFAEHRAERAEAVVAFLRQHPGAIAYTGGEWAVWHREGCPARAQSYHAFFDDDFDAAVAHAMEQYANVPVRALDASGRGDG